MDLKLSVLLNMIDKVTAPLRGIAGSSAATSKALRETRQRLKDLMNELTGGNEIGYIVRTNAEGQTREALAEDVEYLGKLWASLQ